MLKHFFLQLYLGHLTCWCTKATSVFHKTISASAVRGVQHNWNFTFLSLISLEPLELLSEGVSISVHHLCSWIPHVWHKIPRARRCNGITVPLCLCWSLEELSYNQVWFQLVSLPLTARLLTPLQTRRRALGLGSWCVVSSFSFLFDKKCSKLWLHHPPLAPSTATALQWQLLLRYCCWWFHGTR